MRRPRLQFVFAEREERERERGKGLEEVDDNTQQLDGQAAGKTEGSKKKKKGKKGEKKKKTKTAAGRLKHTVNSPL